MMIFKTSQKLVMKTQCVLGSSRISQKSEALIVSCSQRKELISFVFYCFENHSIVRNFGITGPIQVRFAMYLSK